MNLLKKMFRKEQTEEDVQRAANKSILKELVKRGDHLIQERLVTHWLYFKTENNRNSFLQQIKNDNFTIVTQDYNEELDYPFSLQIERVDKVDSESVDTYVLYLWKLVKENNGDYDGWETSVENEK